MLDDGVSQKSPSEAARWHPVGKHLLSGVLDDILRRTCRDSTRARVVKSSPQRRLTPVGRQVHTRVILDDYRLYLHGIGRCLTAESRQAPLECVLGDAAS